MLIPAALSIAAAITVAVTMIVIADMICADGVQRPADATPLPPSVATSRIGTPRAPRKPRPRIEYDPLDHRIPLAEVERRMNQFPAWVRPTAEAAGLPDLNPIEPGPLHVIGDIPTLELAVVQ
jgi:hypothetical protein